MEVRIFWRDSDQKNNGLTTCTVASKGVFLAKFQGANG